MAIVAAVATCFVVVPLGAAAEPAHGSEYPPVMDQRAAREGKGPGPRALRADDHATVTAGIALYQVVGASYGATAGVYLGQDTLLEIDAYRAGAVVPNQVSQAIGLRVQQFVAERVYLRLGPRFRHVEHGKVLDFEDNEERLIQDDIGIDAALGFRWQKPDGLVIGLDAIDVYAPLHAFSTRKQVVDVTNEEVLTTEPVDLELIWDVRFAHFYLGFSF